MFKELRLAPQTLLLLLLLCFTIGGYADRAWGPIPVMQSQPLYPQVRSGVLEDWGSSSNENSFDWSEPYTDRSWVEYEHLTEV